MSQRDKLSGTLIMSEKEFWNLIDQAQEACGKDQNSACQFLQDMLVEMGPDYAQDFHDIVHAYEELSDKFGLWSAAGMMGHDSDDSFIDFRAWLISQGREAYYGALRNPDSLAELDPGDGHWFESFTYIGDKALKSMTGRSAYHCTDQDAYGRLLNELKAGIQYWEGIDYPFASEELPEYFPHLYEQYPDKGASWLLTNPIIQAAREAGPPPRPVQETDLELGGM